MANDSFRAGILDGLLREAGIPIDGISVLDISAMPPVVNVQYTDAATQEQRDLGAQIVAAFDWRRRRALDRATVVTALGQLTAQQITQVLRHTVCEQLRTNPALATKLNAALGVSLTVDEIDPH